MKKKQENDEADVLLMMYEYSPYMKIFFSCQVSPTIWHIQAINPGKPWKMSYPQGINYTFPRKNGFMPCKQTMMLILSIWIEVGCDSQDKNQRDTFLSLVQDKMQCYDKKQGHDVYRNV